MKRFLFIVLAVILFAGCASVEKNEPALIKRVISRPRSNDIGSAVGLVEVNLDKDFRIFPKGRIIDNIIILIQNIETGRTYTGFAKRGLYYVLNAEPGFYYIKTITLAQNHLTSNYVIRHTLQQREVFHIEQGRMNVVQNIKLNITNLSGYFVDEFAFELIMEPANRDLLRGAFTFLDENGYWSDFEW